MLVYILQRVMWARRQCCIRKTICMGILSFYNRYFDKLEEKKITVLSRHIDRSISSHSWRPHMVYACKQIAHFTLHKKIGFWIRFNLFLLVPFQVFFKDRFISLWNLTLWFDVYLLFLSLLLTKRKRKMICLYRLFFRDVYLEFWNVMTNLMITFVNVNLN